MQASHNSDDILEAAKNMRQILGTLEEYSLVEDEVKELYGQLDLIESAVRGMCPENSVVQDEARKFAEGILHSEFCQDQDTIAPFVTELVRHIFVSSDQLRSDKRRKRQMDGIAEAKKQGVKFGHPHKKLPDNFEDALRKWRGGQITIRQAAEYCGMAKSSFYDAAMRTDIPLRPE